MRDAYGGSFRENDFFFPSPLVHKKQERNKTNGVIVFIVNRKQ